MVALGGSAVSYERGIPVNSLTRQAEERVALDEDRALALAMGTHPTSSQMPH